MSDENAISHRELLKNLIARIKEEDLPWYESEVDQSIFWWRALSVLAWAFSLSASIAASFMNVNVFNGYGRSALVILPVLASGTTSFSQIFRFQNKEALREIGRIEIVDIIDNALSFLIDGQSEQEFRSAYHSVRERYHQLELTQHRGYVGLHVDNADQTKEKD